MEQDQCPLVPNNLAFMRVVHTQDPNDFTILHKSEEALFRRFLGFCPEAADSFSVFNYQKTYLATVFRYCS